MFKSGIIVAFFTLLSRIFGLAREFFIAYSFGTSTIADCVNIAFKFPHLFRRIFGEGALSSVFIPIFSKKLGATRDDATNFAGSIFCLLLLVLSALTILVEIFMPYLMLFIAPGFYSEPEKFALSIHLCRITTPYLIFLSFVALFGGMLNSVGRFWALSFAPIILSSTVILFTYYFQDYYTAHYSIAFSLLVAGVLQIAFMLFNLQRAEILFPVRLDRTDPDLKQFFHKLTPAVLASGAQQLNLFISNSISSFLPGAISVLSYADRLYQLPLALIGITFGTILLPELSKLYKGGDHVRTQYVQNSSIKIVLLISIPAACGLFVLSEPIISLIYERGEFVRSDTTITAKALSAFAVGLPAFALAKVLLPVYYANLDTKTPLHITLKYLVVNFCLSVSLMVLFDVIGIAIAVSIATWINVWWLMQGIKQYGDFTINPATLRYIYKIIAASCVMSLYLYIADFYLYEHFFSDVILIKIVSIMAVIISAMIIFFAGAFILGLHK